MLLVALLFAVAAIGQAGQQADTARAATTCVFTFSGTTMTLTADCTTDQTIDIPDGFTLDGANHTVTAVDPVGGHFLGAVVKNAGDEAHVKRLTVTTLDLINVCDNDDDRLRGILFDGAAGTITNNIVTNVNQGLSGCQEGNAIEVRNAPFDGAGTNPLVVDMKGNRITAYQKTGIVANGNVAVTIENNFLDGANLPDHLAANGIQIAYGARGIVVNNHIGGNQWCGSSDYAATAVLIYAAGAETEVSGNNIRGNADIGIYFWADDGIVNNNRVYEDGDECKENGYDTGVGDYGSNNSVTNNKVRGFDEPYYLPGDQGSNKVIPSH